MADKKISDLPQADLPLDGTELVAIVQGGVTKRAAVSEVSGVSFTESKLTVTSSQVTIPTGFVIGIFYNGFRLENTLGYNISDTIVTFTGNPDIEDGETVTVITAI